MLIMLSTDLIIEVISQLNIYKGCSPSFDDIHRAVVARLNVSLGDDDVKDEIEKLMEVGLVVKDCRGGFIVKG